MKRKLTVFLLVILGIVVFVGCQKPKAKVALPNLNNAQRALAMTKLDEIGLNIIIKEEVNNKITAGLFSSYGNNLKQGDLVEVGSDIEVYFAINKNTLPDLTGLTKEEAIREFNYVKFNVTYEEIESADAEPGMFLRYENHKAGDELPENFEVTVYFALEPFPEKNNLIISKYIEGRSGNKAIELYNGSKINLDLSQFQLGIYTNGSETPTETIQLEGTIKPSETYLLVGLLSEDALKEKADKLLALNFDGNDAVALQYKNQVLDVVGHIGMGLYIIHDVTLVRDISIETNNNKYVVSQWNEYIQDHYPFMKTHPVEYPITFNLPDMYKSLNYFEDDFGTVLVTYSHTADGDTTYFQPHFMDNKRVRYVGVDTPETGEPGQRGEISRQATNYTHTKLSEATTIYVQYDVASGRIDNYNRQLGLVWYDGKLLNYELVRRGFSQNNYSDPDKSLVFDGISLDAWFRNAEAYAKANKLGIWGIQH